MTHASSPDYADASLWRGTTIIAVRKDGRLVVAGDGQVSIGPTVMKGNAKKVRRLAGGDVIAGFAGATADAFALFERLEGKLEQYPKQLARARGQCDGTLVPSSSPHLDGRSVILRINWMNR